jgi:hypothetical protein
MLCGVILSTLLDLGEELIDQFAVTAGWSGR